MRGYQGAGTFRKKATAKDVAEKMRKEGYSVKIVKEKTRWGNYTLYRKKK